MSAPTILIATVMRPSGDTGVQTHFRALREYLDAAARPCELITPYNAPLWLVYPVFALRRLLEPFSSELSVWWYRRWHAYFLKVALQRRLRRKDACVVYAQCPLSASAALEVRLPGKQRVMMVTHFNVSQADEWAGKGQIAKEGVLYRAIQAFEAAVLPQLDGLIFVSDFMRRALLARIPEIAKVRTAIVPNFLPDPGPPTIRDFKADLINIGTLEARKNQAYLLDILASLRDMGQALRLTLVGDGPDRLALERKTRTLKLEALVHFAGCVPQAADEIHKHRAYVHVATMESFGITLIEAMARGRPVFAAPVGGVPEVMGDTAAGWALPLTDAKAAAHAIATAMRNGTELAARGEAARVRFLKEYTSDVAAERLLRFLES